MNLRPLAATVLILSFCGCAATAIKQTWKSPTFQSGPVEKVAVLAVDDRDRYRQSIESHFAGLLNDQGQGALATYNLLTLAQIKANKQAAVEQVRQAGGDSVLIVRLMDKSTYSTRTRGSSMTFTGGESADWHGYVVGYTGVEASWNELTTKVYLESSLYNLKSGQRIWSAITETVLNEGADRLAEIEPLAATIFTAMRNDGLIH